MGTSFISAWHQLIPGQILPYIFVRQPSVRESNLKNENDHKDEDSLKNLDKLKKKRLFKS